MLVGEMVRQVLVHQLEWMDGRRRRCLPVDGSHLASDRIFEVGVAASLSDPGAFSVDGDGARYNQVYVRQFARADGLCQTRGALDRRGGRQIASLEPRGIERKKSGKRASASVFGSRRLTACRMSWLTSRSGLPTRSASTAWISPSWTVSCRSSSRANARVSSSLTRSEGWNVFPAASSRQWSRSWAWPESSSRRSRREGEASLKRSSNVPTCYSGGSAGPTETLSRKRSPTGSDQYFTRNHDHGSDGSWLESQSFRREGAGDD